MTGTPPQPGTSQADHRPGRPAQGDPGRPPSDRSAADPGRGWSAAIADDAGSWGPAGARPDPVPTGGPVGGAGDSAGGDADGRRAAAAGSRTDADRASLWRQAGGWGGIATALGLFALTRLGQLLFIVLLAPPDNPDVRGRLLAWDGGWFTRVATEGYPHTYTYGDGGVLLGNGLAFFPFYPLLIRGVVLLGAVPGDAALIVASLAAAAGAVALHLLGTSLYSRRTGFVLVVLCCAQPMSVVLSMGYSEGLFLALLAGMLVAAHRRAWLVAGLLGLGAALTRPTGVAAALALTLAAVLAMRTAPPPERWRAAAGAALALIGAPAYLLWVGLRIGDLDAWFRIQAAGWGTSFDAGASMVRFLAETLRRGEGWVPVSTALIILAAVVSAGIALAARPWPPLAGYGVLALILVLGQAGYYHSKPRLLVPVLLVLVPAAVALARARPRAAALALTGYAAFGLWYGAYLITVWPYTI